MTCRSCGWTGPGKGNEELYEELLDVSCPECDRMILIVPYPTIDADAGGRSGRESPRD